MKHYACAISDTSVIAISQRFGGGFDSSKEVLNCAKILSVALGAGEDYITGFSNSTHRNVIKSFYSWFYRCEGIVKERNMPAQPVFVYTNLEVGVTVIFKWIISDFSFSDQPGSGISSALKLALMSRLAKACDVEEMFPGSV